MPQLFLDPQAVPGEPLINPQIQQRQAAASMVACIEDMNFDIPCVDEPFDICERLGRECNLAVPLGSICDYIPAGPMQDRCVEWRDAYLNSGEGWTIDSGTCQDLMDVGGACTEDADCLEGLTCNTVDSVCE